MTEAEVLFTEILSCQRADLYLNKGSPLTREKSSFVSSVLKRRISGQPLEYILGRTEFMGLEFKVTPQVLIPRPETEILVETARRYLSQMPDVRNGENILDLGTGSGCIAVSLAKFFSNAKIAATDISMQALDVARQNAKSNNVEIDFLQSDLFSNCGLWTVDCGLIISNPPYIATDEIDTLQHEVNCQPRLALDGGEDGLDFYRRIVQQAPEYLKTGGGIILEMGYNQKEAVENILSNSGRFEIIEIVKDYSGIDRVIVARNTKK